MRFQSRALGEHFRTCGGQQMSAVGFGVTSMSSVRAQQGGSSSGCLLVCQISFSIRSAGLILLSGIPSLLGAMSADLRSTNIGPFKSSKTSSLTPRELAMTLDAGLSTCGLCGRSRPGSPSSAAPRAAGQGRRGRSPRKAARSSGWWCTRGSPSARRHPRMPRPWAWRCAARACRARSGTSAGRPGWNCRKKRAASRRALGC
mmetsp:Transcript_38255/g.119430  ORF Transcript_38255/g.119430 Transcript_38255/m.119430 type:complete len:202 (+) Transcript_38255:600-1205(+)